ncbi:IclR family transcriptional regulator [Leekyejoonella antrihumi]|uniref:IclR family transcriptional regulator n=1 Tax=Leekyejoonella antrihumi TaxID=1660198 RepID=A0A563E0K0_9MICO|nr:IclR family transcriptional regulator [Leekyejoonella antrihumi]TWP36046.1 IclR family transcriptional regulator [Leekyejoonella antrihumi]
MTSAKPSPAHPGGTQAIQRALGLLLALSEHDELTITQLAGQTGLTAGTTSRMAKALAAEGMIRRNPVTDAYHLGARTALLGQAAQRVLGLDKALPAMRELARQTKESVNLSIREGPESVVLLRVQSTLPLRFEQTIGARFPLYSTASGKVILAFGEAPEGYLQALPERLDPVAPGTLATRGQLIQQLEEIRGRGYAVDVEENVEGVRCVGAPVLDESGHAHAAIVLQAPAVRMRRDRVAALGPLVIDTAAEVSHVVPDDTSLSH